MEPTVRDARAAYFAASGLPPDGGYADAWVRTRLGPIPFAYPNTAGRQRLAPAHDLHHVATGYRTDLVGEAEIGAWEIGTRMPEPVGVYLALLVLGFSFPRAPGRCLRAFARGRRSRWLDPEEVDDALLDGSVDALRQRLGLAGAPVGKLTPGDRWVFAGWVALALAIVWGPLVPMSWLVWRLVA